MAYNPANGFNVWRTTFASAVSNNIDTNYWTLVQTGTGQTVNQTGGKLLLTSGTTANAETIIRSKVSWQSWNLTLRYFAVLSQRIANNNFYIELVDVIGDGLSFTINSATSVTVTIPSNTFTSANVGQSMYIGAIAGAAGVPMKGTIASVSGNNVTFTVAGWPATGSGTCSLFGWNYQQIQYTSTSASNANYDAQRKGYASGFTNAVIFTTASPGHVVQLHQDENASTFSDSSGTAGGTGNNVTYAQRAARLFNLPTNEYPLYVQIRAANGTTAPASNTTLTVGFVAMDDMAPAPVVIEGATQFGPGMSLATNVVNAPATSLAVTGYPTAAASADALANPTVTQIGAADLCYNGASWDRRRNNNAFYQDGTTGAKTANFNSGVLTNYNGSGGIYIANVTAVSGTSPTLTAQLQFSFDGGTTWLNYGPATAALTAAGQIMIGCFPCQWSDASSVTLAAFTAGAAVTKFFNAPVPRTTRIAFTLGGTTPSFTFNNNFFINLGA